MKQMSFADAEYAGKRKQARRERFLIEMDWKGLIALIEPHYPKGEGGRPAYPLMAMLTTETRTVSCTCSYSHNFRDSKLIGAIACLMLERLAWHELKLGFYRIVVPANIFSASW